MARLIHIRQVFRSDGQRDYKYYFNDTLSPDDQLLLFYHFEPSSLPMFRFSVTALEAYEMFHARERHRMSSSGSRVLDLPAFKAAWTALWDSLSPEKRAAFVTDYTIEKFNRALSSTRRQLTLFMGEVECYNCGELEQPAILYSSGVWPYERIATSFEANPTDKFVCVNLTTNECACCKPEKYQVLVNSSMYVNYSQHRRGLCRCAGCRAY